MKTYKLQNKNLVMMAAAILISFGLSAQTKTLPDGTVVYPDNHRQLPNGTVIYPPVYDKKVGILGSIFGPGNPRKKTLAGGIFGNIFGKKKSNSSVINSSTGSVLGSIFGPSKGKPKTLPNGNTVFPGQGRVKNFQSVPQKTVAMNDVNSEISDVVVLASQQRHAIKRASL